MTDPLTDPNLAPLLDLWLEADKTAEANGVRVNTWPDSTGHGHSAVKVSANGATKVTNVINGQPVLRFAGVEGYDCGVVDLSGGGARKDLELIVVGTMNTLANTVAIEHGTDLSADLAVHAGQSAGAIEFHARGDAGDNLNTVPYPGAVPYTFFGDLRFDKSRTYETELRYSASGEERVLASAAANNTNALTSAHLYVGARTGNAVFWSGDFALIALMRRITDRGLHARLLDWIATKYGWPTY